MFDRMADHDQFSLMPGTLVKTPVVMPSNSAGSDLAGRPAPVAAGATYSGRNLVSSFVRTDEYSETATAPRAVRIEPMTPATRPMSSASQTKAIEDKVRFST